MSSKLEPTDDGETKVEIPEEGDDIRSKKKLMRKQIRARVREIANDEEEIDKQSNQVWERLFALKEYQEAKSIGLFLSMPKGEINTDPALRHAIQRDKTIYVPQVGKNFEHCDMELLKVILPTTKEEDKEESTSSTMDIFHKDWPRNKWNIPEPPPDMPIVTAQPGDIDLLVVPGLGFDRKGNRLGQGKGYYDRFIDRMTMAKSLPLIAVGLTPQLVVDETIPVAEYDRRMDMILLPEEVIVSNKKRTIDQI